MFKKVIDENFMDFSLGEFPYDKGHSALGEYHNIMPEGYRGNWYDPIAMHIWRASDGSWLITGDGNKHYLEQNRGNIFTGYFSDLSAILVCREELFSSYIFDFKIRLFDTLNESGVVFNYLTSKKHNALVFGNNKIKIIRREQKDVTVLAEMDFVLDDLITYDVRLVVDKNILVYVNNELVFETNTPFTNGKIGVIGRGLCRYSDIIVQMTEENYSTHLSKKTTKYNEIALKQQKYPQMECINKIDLKNFGSGRQFRVSHKSNGEIFFILAQHKKRLYRDSYASISCLTAFDLSGSILWQIGEPNNSFDMSYISCDLPFQVSDINNDGRDELIYAMDFEVCVIDCETGKLIKKMNTPLMREYDSSYPFNRLNVDAIRVADFSGNGYQGDFILKDRYKNVLAFDKDMKLLWRYNNKNTGHFPYICDFNNDGKDEMFVGYDMVSSNGEIIWSLPIEGDHTDEIIYLSTKDNQEKKLYLASGNECFNIVNINGKIEQRHFVGHAQRISIADYDKNREGLEICVTSFWGANDIIYLYDCDCNLICEKEMMVNGNLVTPVNYNGIDQLILSNSDVGLLDSNLDPVVLFPHEDGRPMACQEVLDIDNDGVDEIIVWDQHKMYIYKATRYVTGNEYERYPDNAFSNYRGEYLVKK